MRVPSKLLLVLAGGLAAALGVIARQAVGTRGRVLRLDVPPPKEADFGDPSSPHLHFLVVGDSTSVGVGATSIEKTYPWILARHLGTKFRVKLDVIGRSGARMADAASEFIPQAVALRPELAMIGIGANDVTHVTSLRKFGQHLGDVIEKLRGSGAEVIVALGPRFDTPVIPEPLRTIVRARARALNRRIVRVAKGKGVEVLDLPGALGSSFARDHTLYSDDRYHPGDRGYALWAEVMIDKVMDAALRSRRSQS
jgi:lysophospholipase L1-like esterase